MIPFKLFTTVSTTSVFFVIGFVYKFYNWTSAESDSTQVTTGNQGSGDEDDSFCNIEQIQYI